MFFIRNFVEGFYGSSKSTSNDEDDEEDEDEGPTVSEIVKNYYSQLRDLVVSRISVVAMLDVESKDKNRFEDVFSQFQRQVHELERFFCVYLHVVMMRNMKTKEALEIFKK